MFYSHVVSYLDAYEVVDDGADEEVEGDEVPDEDPRQEVDSVPGKA